MITVTYSGVLYHVEWMSYHRIARDASRVTRLGGCDASDGIFFLFVNWILVNALFYFSCTFVNVLSCVHVCIDCKNTLLCGGNKEYLSIYYIPFSDIFLIL